MPSQRDLAKAANVSQATVSLALRNHPRVAKETVQRIRDAAKRLNYTPNSYVSSLMSHIQSGRTVQDKGCLAIIVDADSMDHWLIHHTYVLQYNAMLHRAEELGFRPEVFFLRGRRMNAKETDRILQTRGIKSLILAAPYFSSIPIDGFDWSRYATVTSGLSWPYPPVDRVASYHREHVHDAYSGLAGLGYRRIGMCLQDVGTPLISSNWLAGYYLNNHDIPQSQKIPLFIWKSGADPRKLLQKWYEKWKPDAIICEHAHEFGFFKELGYSIPEQFGYACLNRPPGSDYSGVEEKNEVIGRTMVDLVVAQTLRNEYGLPRDPKLVLIEGTWVPGNTTSRQSEPSKLRNLQPQISPGPPGK